MNRLYPLTLAACLLSPQALAETPAPRDAFVSQLLQQMTQEEKIGQLRLISIGGQDMPREKFLQEVAAGRIGGTFNSITRAENRRIQQAALQSRLKIPLLFAYDILHGHRTIFPISLGQAATWNLEAIRLAARTSAIEGSADGLDLTFAPMVDISRDPRWGRVSEGFGEDPWLVSRIAETSVRAYQGTSLAAPDSLMASVKHFALYGAVEGGRDYNVVDMSPLRMHQDYLPPYRAALDAGAGAVMVALNTVNGVPATANRWLMQDLLRQQWGFRGLTISDHGAVSELIPHGVARDGQEAARLAISNGIDLSMHDSLYQQTLPGLLASGQVAGAQLDAAVREVLNAKYDLGLFADPFRRIGRAEEDPADSWAEERLHRPAAREVARQSLVLLKNRDRTLPLNRDMRIALTGPLADSHLDMLGSWAAAGQSRHTVTLRQGLQAALGDPSRLLYARGANISNDPAIINYLNVLSAMEPEVVQDPRTPEAMIDEAVQAARQADVIVAAVGEARSMSHEAVSRTTLGLPDSQQALLRALKATGKPLVLVLMNGRPLALNWENEQADALLETWFSGTEGGHAIAEVLLGDYNPSGKLPVSFPRSVGQIPTYYNRPRLGRPFDPQRPDHYTSQYFEEPNGPLYPFGHGLSYTRFELANLQLSASAIGPDGQLEASATLTNHGDRAGSTVVQLYIRDVAASVVRPVKELKGFQRVELEPGASITLHFPVNCAQLGFYDARGTWQTEPGDFILQLGLDSQQVEEQRFTLLADSATPGTGLSRPGKQ